MSATVQFRCPNCGYETPSLYEATGYYCEHCNEVYNGYSNINYFTWMKKVKKGKAVCKVCNIGVLKEWNEVCPKCGTEMYLDSQTTEFFF